VRFSEVGKVRTKKLLVRCHAVTERCMRSQGQNYTHDIIRQRAPLNPATLK
jgi:hypothetical protein